MKARYLFVALTLLSANNFLHAGEKTAPCSSTLPSPIRRYVDAKYIGWNLASCEMLNQTEKERFKPLLRDNCYGAIRGHFTNEGTSYALYLLRPLGNGYENQLVVLQEGETGITRHVLVPASFTASAVVLRKLPPGTSIIDANTGKHFLPKHDVISLFDPDKGEVNFFWKAGKFISVSISE